MAWRRPGRDGYPPRHTIALSDFLRSFAIERLRFDRQFRDAHSQGFGNSVKVLCPGVRSPFSSSFVCDSVLYWRMVTFDYARLVGQTPCLTSGTTNRKQRENGIQLAIGHSIAEAPRP